MASRILDRLCRCQKAVTYIGEGFDLDRKDTISKLLHACMGHGISVTLKSTQAGLIVFTAYHR